MLIFVRVFSFKDVICIDGSSAGRSTRVLFDAFLKVFDNGKVFGVLALQAFYLLHSMLSSL